MEKSRLYYNPDCSKCRAALAWLRERGIEPELIDYLRNPPSPAAIEEILQRLDAQPRDIMRRDEASYQALNLDAPEHSRQQLIAAIHAQPVLLQRPILLHRGGAVLGRPIERLQHWVEALS